MSCIELTKLDDHNGDIVIIYDAGGRQLKLTKTTPTDPTEIYHYHGGIEYKKGKRESISFGEGRVIYNGNLESTNGPLRIYREWMMSDHLGNTRVRFVDKDGNGKIQTEEGATPEEYELSGSYHYYPFGMVMEGTFSEHQGVKNKYQYNGIEHMDFIGHGISLTTFRVHDAAVGRWWQIDPKAEAQYGYSPYASMNNNPISMSDPNGDTPWGVIVGATVGAIGGFIDGGFKGAIQGAALGALNGAISMGMSNLGLFGNLGGGFGVGLTPQLALGTNGIGFGFNASLRWSKGGFFAGLNIGGSDYLSMSGTGSPGWEGRINFALEYRGGASVDNEFKSTGLNIGFSSNQFLGGGVSQRTGRWTAGWSGYNVSYENDQPWPIPISDGEDRFRTTGIRFSYAHEKHGTFALGLNMFTGDPGTSGTRTFSIIDGKKTYNSGSSDSYRLGALYGEWNGMRAGWNSEKIRHVFQNKFAHDFISKGQNKAQGPWHFRQIPGKFPGGFYQGFYSSNPFTSW